MQPTRSLILLTGAWAILGFVVGIYPALILYWIWVGAIVGGVALLDFSLLIFSKTPSVSRELSGKFALSVEQGVKLKIQNTTWRKVNVVCYDGIPSSAVSDEMPWKGWLPHKGYKEVTYPATLSERGMVEFSPTHLLVYSLLTLWRRNCRSGEAQYTRVYPNYEPMLRYALLAMDNKAEYMGIVKKNRAGLSREFHQLRDYHLGDMLSSIDWKATSKHLSLISRSYQEQRDQTVILAVDCGRRMRALDDGVPQFDYCLNAMLLLAYTALKQGDHVGIIGLGSDSTGVGSTRWLAPVRGIQSMKTILNHLYDYQTTASPSDYTEAAKLLMTYQQRRALVVMMTNVRGEDFHQIVEPMRMIRRRHVTILANLREASVHERMDKVSVTLDDALEVGAASIYLEQRAKVLAELRSHGVFTLDKLARDLPVSMANAYLAAREMV